jgi:putative ABC transport system permease protein
MDWLGKTVRRLRMLVHRREFDADLEEEMRLHLELRQQEQLQTGVPIDDARAAARRQFGNATYLKEESHIAWGWEWFEHLVEDLRYGLRMLRRSSGFTTVAVLTLALGIGANTAILAVMNAVLFPRLPYPSAGQLVSVYNRNLKVQWDYAEFVSIPFWRDIAARNRTFDDVAAYTWNEQYNLSGAGQASRVRATMVSTNIFSVIGRGPATGRGFLPDESRAGQSHVAIISDKLWRERFGARAEIIGQKIQLNREMYQVIGVLPPDFQLCTLVDREDLLLPLQTDGAEAERRDLRSVILVGRLKLGINAAAAQADLSAVAEQLTKLFPASDGGWGANVVPLRDDLEPSGVTRLRVFLGLASLILVVACLNVSLLLLVRNERRRHETCIRVSLGATRGQIVRMRLCESALLSVFGALLGLAFAGWGSRLLIAYTPPDLLSHVRVAPIDFRVLAVTGLVCLVTMFLVGLLPATRGFDANLIESLRRGNTRVAGHQQWRFVLVGIEVAIGLVLIAGAGLLVRSLHQIMKLDLGFDADNVVSAQIHLDATAYPKPANRIAFFEQAVEQLRREPGVSATYGSNLPFGNNWLGNRVILPGQGDANSNSLPYCGSAFVEPQYFRILRTPIVAGRDFTPNEVQPVVIINQSMAREFFGGKDPIGKFLMFLPNVNAAYNGAPEGARQVIGVAKNLNDDVVSYNSQTDCAAFFPYVQNPVASPVLIVRAAEPRAAVASLRQEVSQLDAAEPIYNLQPMAEALRAARGSWQFQGWFAGLAACVALMLAALGLYGMVSHSVQERTKEVGIRVALGGQPGRIVARMIKEGVRAIALGTLVGVFAVAMLTRSLVPLLYQVKPLDPWVLAGGLFVLAATGLIASYIPARRAARVDPMVALRDE